jgi:hypothetical protein
MTPNRGNTEPAADMRTFAGKLFQMHTALVKSGFTPTESLKIIGHVIAAGIDKAKGQGKP